MVIAKMEATENDLPPKTPFKVEGFPTIKLIKAGDNEILDYQGDRTVEAFIEFLEANAVNKGGFVVEEDEDKTDKPLGEKIFISLFRLFFLSLLTKSPSFLNSRSWLTQISV